MPNFLNKRIPRSTPIMTVNKPYIIDVPQKIVRDENINDKIIDNRSKEISTSEEIHTSKGISTSEGIHNKELRKESFFGNNDRALEQIQDNIRQLSQKIYDISRTVDQLIMTQNQLSNAMQQIQNDLRYISTTIQSSSQQTSAINAKVNDLQIVSDKIEDSVQSMQRNIDNIPQEFQRISSQIANIRIYTSASTNDWQNW